MLLGCQVELPPEVAKARTAYAKMVLKACSHHIQGGKINARKSQPVICTSWVKSKYRKAKYPSADVKTGVPCEARCGHFPCAAFLEQLPEEAAIREMPEYAEMRG